MLKFKLYIWIMKLFIGIKRSAEQKRQTSDDNLETKVA